MAFSFHEDYYIASKLAQLQAAHITDSQGNAYIATTLRAAIAKAGMTLEQHYERYSTAEGTSANPYFNTQEYLHAKLAQLNSTHEGNKTWTMSMLQDALKKAGLSAEAHYHKYGSHEYDANGKLINPSNAFDANAYASAKLAQLQATDPEHWSNKTAKDVVNAISKAGMDIIQHYERYGAKEGDNADIAMAQTVPVVERMANDPLRAITGENVPSNYNPASKAPYEVTLGTAVAKPQDMGSLAKESLSPTIVKPVNPTPTPSDTDYVPVTNNGIADTALTPAVLASATVLNQYGTPITLSAYGLQSGNNKGGGNKSYFPIQSDGTIDPKAKALMTVAKDASGAIKTDVTVTDAQGNSITESRQTNAEGTTTSITTKATLSDGTTITGKGTETLLSNGAVTVKMEEQIKDPAGVTHVVKSSTTSIRNADGSITNDSTVETGDTQAMTLEIISKETITTNTEGAQHSKLVSSTKDASKTVMTSTATSDAYRSADGTVTTHTSTTTKNADGSTSYEDRTEKSILATDGTTTDTITINAHTNDSKGVQIGTEKGSITIETKATGAVNALKDIVYVDSTSGSTTHETTISRYDPIKNETITTQTLSTTDKIHTTPKVETTTVTTKGDVTEGILHTDSSQNADDLDTHPSGSMTLAQSSDGLTITGTLNNFVAGDDAKGTMSITLTPDSDAAETVFYASYSVDDKGNVTWTSNNPKNLAIDDKGNISITGLTAGTTYAVSVALKDSDDYAAAQIGSAEDFTIRAPDNALFVSSTTVNVSESGLPGGTEEGKNYIKTGSIDISGTPTDITVNGVSLFPVGDTKPDLNIITQYGNLTFDTPGNGPLGFTYTLRDSNNRGKTISEVVSVVASDANDTVKSGTITIKIADDSPLTPQQNATVSLESGKTDYIVIPDKTVAFGADGAASSNAVTGTGTYGTLSYTKGNYHYATTANLSSLTEKTFDTITYTVRDGDGSIDQGTMNITLIPQGIAPKMMAKKAFLAKALPEAPTDGAQITPYLLQEGKTDTLHSTFALDAVKSISGITKDALTTELNADDQLTVVATSGIKENVQEFGEAKFSVTEGRIDGENFLAGSRDSVNSSYLIQWVHGDTVETAVLRDVPFALTLLERNGKLAFIEKTALDEAVGNGEEAIVWSDASHILVGGDILLPDHTESTAEHSTNTDPAVSLIGIIEDTLQNDGEGDNA